MAILFLQCKGEKKYHDDVREKIEVTDSSLLQEIIQFQNELNKEYKNPDESPLPDRYRKNFEGLDFFPADTSYIVYASFVRTPDALPFLMPTTTDRESEEVTFGVAHFILNGEKYQLEVYQNKELMLEEGYEEYLFLPFLDNTNGEETYTGGRYIDLTVPDGDVIKIDFNRAYNPYCAYNKKYSCPIVPKVNAINTKILAGVKAFNKGKK